MTIYKNYGCLAAEKRIIYTFGAPQPTATCYDKINVDLPDGWHEVATDYGDAVKSPWGAVYWISEVLAGNKRPEFAAYDYEGSLHRYELETV